MSVINNNMLAGASGQAGGAAAGYEIERSVRFNPSDSASLTKTFSATGSQTTYTFSFWLKKNNSSSVYQNILIDNDSSSSQIRINDTAGGFELRFAAAGANAALTTNRKFRDPSAWYHIVCVYDSTNATSSDRMRIYVNGMRETSFLGETQPTQNLTSPFITNGHTYTIGYFASNTALDGYLADVHFIDGQALTPTSFGEFDATTGVWNPIAYTGSYGTNGFHLDFADNSSAAALGYDAAGSNDWTVNNIATGSSYSTNLTPASTAYANTTLSNGGLTWTGSTPNDTGTVSSLTIPTNKKTYVEVTHTSSGGGEPGPGVAVGPTVEMGSDGVKAWWRGGSNGGIERGTLGAFTGGTTTWSNGDVLGIALDHTTNSGAGSITFYKNGVQAWTGGSGWTSYNDLRFEWQNNGSGTDSGTWNYGLTAFSYPVAGHTGLSAPAGAGEDSLRDSPTNGDTANDTGAGGEVPGNYATLNPLNSGGSGTPTLTNGNLEFSLAPSVGAIGTYSMGSIATTTGKWYWEVALTSNYSNAVMFGLMRGADHNTYGSNTGVVYYGYNGNKIVDGSSSSYGSSFTNGDIIGVALNLDSGTVTFYKNNSSQGAITLPSSTSGWKAYVGNGSSGGTQAGVINFGSRTFAYTAPSGFKALCTANLPTPTIEDGSTAMDVATWIGDGSSSRSITGLGFSPDLVWVKRRDSSSAHRLSNTVSGNGKILYSDFTDPETPETTSITSLDSTGFSIGNSVGVNATSGTYVAWTWDGGSSTVSNTDGSITSSVRANASAGFSIVSFNSGSAGNYTVGHGLGAKPHLIITKARNGSTFNWSINHISIATTVNKYLTFTTNGTFDNGAAAWGASLSDTNSTTFGISSANAVEASKDCIAYCFAPVAGYSSFGSYTGNGSSTDGPFVFTGFRPRWVMAKASSQTGDWAIIDTARNSYNVSDAVLYPNASYAEDTANVKIDALSNGFKLRSTTGNGSSATYVWAAFAESPQKYARAR